MAKTVTTTVRLPEPLHQYVREAAQARGVSLSEFMREAISIRLAFVYGMHMNVDDERWKRLVAAAAEIARIDVWDDR